MVKHVKEILIDVVSKPGWVLLSVGIVLIAAGALLGPYLEYRQLLWQRDLLLLQAKRLGEQEEAYRTVVAALDRGDPTMLQRVAYHYLRVIPAGTRMLVEGSGIRAVGGRGQKSSPTAEAVTTLDAMLRVPMPVVGVDYPAPSKALERLEWIASGPVGLAIFVVGVVFFVLGLVPGGVVTGWLQGASVGAVERCGVLPAEVGPVLSR